MTEKHPPNTDEMMLKKGLVTPDVAARAIGQTKANVIGLVHDGKLRHIRFGTGSRARIYVEWSSVIEHIGEEAAVVLGLKASRPPLAT